MASGGGGAVLRISDASRSRWVSRVYVAVASLLLAHEMDSVYWREWDLFGLPGGEPLFVAVHVPLIALVVWGYGRLLADRRSGFVVAFLLALSGTAALFIHGGFLLSGSHAFESPLSLALIGAMFVLALPLLAVSGARLAVA